MLENQTAWNSNNQRIKKTVNQTNETSKMGRWRELESRQETMQVRLAEQETETQSSLWTMAGVAVVAETPSVTLGFVPSLESRARDKQGSALFPLWHLTGSTTAQQGGLPCPGEYLRPCPLTT